MNSEVRKVDRVVVHHSGSSTMAAASAEETDYIPSEYKDQILEHTKMLGGGESDTIEFEAPAAGTYDFLCTFPGHYALMQGKFIVE